MSKKKDIECFYAIAEFVQISSIIIDISISIIVFFDLEKYHFYNIFCAKKNGNGIYFVNYFKDKGYITGKTTTFCEKTSVILDKTNNLRWDYEGISIP